MAAFLFYVVLAGFIAHELDAAHKRAWLLLFVLRGMPEDPAHPTYEFGTAPCGSSS